MLGELAIVAADVGKRIACQGVTFDIDRSRAADASQDPGGSLSL
jgi:hypothetical protein